MTGKPKRVRKAVLPVAGLGTRFLPATKAMPKEMLTIVDKPLIQYVVDEAREAGIEHFIFVTGRNKGVIEDHFDRMYELDATLAARAKKAEMEILARDQPEAGAMSFTRQQAPDNFKGFLESRRTRPDVGAHGGEPGLAPAEPALHDEGALSDGGQCPDLLGHQHRVPQREQEQTPGRGLAPLREQPAEHRRVLVIGRADRQ